MFVKENNDTYSNFTLDFTEEFVLYLLYRTFGIVNVKRGIHMKKKDQLLINAARIVNEEGIQKLTMSYLAEASEITKGGILYHFENKEELLYKMNEKVINEFEDSIRGYKANLTGPYQYTRAYALATMDYLTEIENILLPAVFISSHEDKRSKAYWEDTIKRWDEAFENDQGDQNKILELRMICDGIWFTLTYNISIEYKEKMETVVRNYIQSLEKEVN